MSKRLEAAVKAWDHHWGDRYGDEALEEMGEEVKVALDAADAVMFSEEAVERAARAEYESDMEDLPGGLDPWDHAADLTRANYRRGVLAVIASLRGEA
jgi:hypothetical protein